MKIIKTFNNKTFQKANIILNKAQMLEGELKNNLNIIFNDFSEIEQIIKENNINKNNLRSINFN
jgi:hypothetical protein